MSLLNGRRYDYSEMAIAFGPHVVYFQYNEAIRSLWPLTFERHSKITNLLFEIYCILPHCLNKSNNSSKNPMMLFELFGDLMTAHSHYAPFHSFELLYELLFSMHHNNMPIIIITH